MNQPEPPSDLDSNTSWIFVDDCPIDNQPSKNDPCTTYDGVSMQELTLPSSNLANVEQETDSDGISIISETDDMKENSGTEEPPLGQEIQNISGQIMTQEKVVKKRDDFDFNKYFIISLIVIAMLTPVVLNYFITSNEDNIENSRGKSELVAEEVDVLINNDHSMSDSHCTTKNFIATKRKYHSKGETDRLNCKEHLCPLSQLNKENEKLEQKLEIESSQEILDKPENYNQKKDVPRKIRKDTKLNLQENYKKLKEGNTFIVKQKGEKAKQGNKKKDYDSRSNNFSKKKGKTEKNESSKRQKKKKSKKGKEKSSENTNNHIDEQIRKLKKVIDEKDKYIKDLTKVLKIKDKHLKMLEHKVLKHLNTLTNGKKSENEILKDVSDIKSTLKKVNATSGEWYSKLYKGRSKIRNQHHASDWLFERADFRNKKRNLKNNWYWNWMTDREQLRVKKGLWQFTY